MNPPFECGGEFVHGLLWEGAPASRERIMETVRIPNQATYSPISLTDLMIAAPLASRLLLGATPPGRALQAAALGAYAGSVALDWFARRNVRAIDFPNTFGADVRHLVPMSREEREREAEWLAERVNDEYTAERVPRPELARLINRHLTDFIANITGQRVETSSELRRFSLAGLVFPFALGTCDIFSGDVSILRDAGVFEPHIIAHEFAHRKGYFKELHAQVLGYLAMAGSGEAVLAQSARCERLHRNLWVLADRDPGRYRTLIEERALRGALRTDFLALHPEDGRAEGVLANLLRRLYDERMRLTGQNGLSDYDEGFTNFLHASERRTAEA